MHAELWCDTCRHRASCDTCLRRRRYGAIVDVAVAAKFMWTLSMNAAFLDALDALAEIMIERHREIRRWEPVVDLAFGGYDELRATQDA